MIWFGGTTGHTTCSAAPFALLMAPSVPPLEADCPRSHAALPFSCPPALPLPLRFSSLACIASLSPQPPPFAAPAGSAMPPLPSALRAVPLLILAASATSLLLFMTADALPPPRQDPNLTQIRPPHALGPQHAPRRLSAAEEHRSSALMDRCTVRYRDATLDHFSWAPSPGNVTTFKQRYFLCLDSWTEQNGRPIFFYAGATPPACPSFPCSSPATEGPCLRPLPGANQSAVGCSRQRGRRYAVPQQHRPHVGGAPPC